MKCLHDYVNQYFLISEASEMIQNNKILEFWFLVLETGASQCN